MKNPDAHPKLYSQSRQWMHDHEVLGKQKCRRAARRLLRAMRTVNRVHEAVKKLGLRDGAYEWLLDNRYLLIREGIDALDALKRAPALPADSQRDVRMLSLCRLLVEKGVFDAACLVFFLQGIQADTSLSEDELWMTVPLLKTALILYAADVCERLADVAGGNDSNTPTALNTAMQNIITTLRWISTSDLREILQQESTVEKILQGDQSGVYAAMDEDSRAYYRARVTALAKRTGKTEEQIATEAVLSDGHIGNFLFLREDCQKRSKQHGMLYFSTLIVASLGLSILGAFVARTWWFGLLFLPLLFDACKQWLDALVLRITPLTHTVKLAYRDGIPSDARTMCVISLLCGSSDKAAHAVGQLERYMLANRDAGEHLVFGLLLDLADTDEPSDEIDELIIQSAKEEIDKLNSKYGGRFTLFTRPRVESNGIWMGHERKRGALMALCRLLRGSEWNLSVHGDKASMQDITYLITLDSDTRLSIGAAKLMAGAMMHPANTPVIDPKKRIVVSGHGILQPRIGVDLQAANQSVFARWFGGQGGFDPYISAAGDVYQDFYGQGSFSGKGILDIDAVLMCLDGRFPDNRILSHDLLEGAYLRAGLLGDVELIDGVPTRALNWFTRLHRWIRGDWQIAKWLCWHVPAHSGREGNPLSALNRWKIFDNLRRSVDCLFQLVLMTLVVVTHGIMAWTAAGALVLLMFAPFITKIPSLWHQSRPKRVKTFGSAKLGAAVDVAKALLMAALLPYRAWMALSAIATALWRVTISKKHLLQWTTAAEADAARTPTCAKTNVRLWANWLWGAGLIAWAQSWLSVGVALMLVFAPTIAWIISRPCKRHIELVAEDREFLMQQASLMWRYFEENLLKEHHYLPPDNFQEQPAVGLAPRTSPTNIGLGLLCALAAVDLQLTNRDRALDLIDKMLSTVEQLEKWNGHIYNWYDTRTLKPLHPCLVSTVDSGNMIGYLIALEQGLLEHDDEYGIKLARRAKDLADAMDLRPLYDKQKRLFAIGYDIDNGKLSDGSYDLLCSEARQTSYIAVARNEVDRKHWRRLSRAMVGQDGYGGMASWTGTMFEYLMPHLLLPRYDNSLLDESCRFAVRAHRRHGARHGVPWGVSESCFYAFDAALNYQYKAHGVQKLAFKRELDKEVVIAPYAAFMALAVEPRAAVKNLQIMCAKGYEGKYGLVEAIDYTPTRQQSPEHGEVIKCYMAHHLGMSLLSIANLLCDEIFIKRFLKEKEMSAFSELLEEKVPCGSMTVKPASPEVPDKPQRLQGEEFHREGDSADEKCPRLHLLSNGAYTLMAADGGVIGAACGSTQLYNKEAFRTCGQRHSGGIFWGLKLGDKIFSLTAMTYYDDIKRTWQFKGGSALWHSEFGDEKTTLAVRVPGNENAEQHTVTVEGVKADITGELVCYFEPMLAPENEFNSHPAFSKLFLQSQCDDNVLTFARRPRGDKQKSYLSVSCDAEDVTYDTSREQSLGRGGFHALERAVQSLPKNTVGSVLDPCMLMRVPIAVKAGGRVTVTMSMAYAGRREDAKAAALRALKYDGYTGGRVDGAMRLLSMGQGDAVMACELGADILFARPNRMANRLNRLGQKDLWKFGISGDLPIVLFHACEEKEKIQKMLKMHRFLGFNGLRYDLILLTRDGSDYHRPMRGHVLNALKELNVESSIDTKGGVHIFDRSVLSDDELTLLKAVARVEVEGSYESPNRQATISNNDRRLRANKLEPLPSYVAKVEVPDDGVISFDTTETLPLQCLSHVLANRAFGAIMCDYGFGHVWRRNARENQITPWRNDLLAHQQEEQIELVFGGQTMSPFAANDGWQCRVEYGTGYAKYVKSKDTVTVTTTVFVPRSAMARVVMLDIQGADTAMLKYQAKLRMGSTADFERYVIVERDENGVIVAQNHYNKDFSPQQITISCTSPFIQCNEQNPLEATAELTGQENNIQAVLCLSAAQNQGGMETVLQYCNWQLSVETLADVKQHVAALTCPKTVQSGDKALDRYLNGWALQQALVCRIYARTSMYQCGGAYGYRDQLQDCCALLDSDPSIARNQLIRAAAHQFEEGDVQHWWHEANRNGCEFHAGVRTRCSDDLLWLPYVLAKYVCKSDDLDLLRQQIPYITSPILEEHEHERYEKPQLSNLRESLLDHCKRAIDMVLNRGVGEHGLLLMLGGDWNDGMNRVGERGLGESVWLTWFAAHTLERFADLCERIGDESHTRYRDEAERLWQSARNAWDGEWYLRGYYDNGRTLGSYADDVCQIDSIAQSFAALDPRGNRERQVQALESAYARLVDEKKKYIKLFTPPFDADDYEPGYIKGYLPGVRENGGQYTHAAVWLAMGFALVGQREKALELLKLLLPANHDGKIYKAEPYVIAADVYDNPEHRGRGGWSWYTGAAGWFYRIAMGLLSEGGE
ncbi:MAG: hypothetical protein FWE06_06475 [Oscillospiraceae bacterium]|nr:hypothetical protein [Oscillospiraceae bacterium]